MDEVTVYNGTDLIKNLISEKDKAALTRLCREADAREIAFLVAHLTMEERVELMNIVPNELGADILQEIPLAHSTEIVSEMDVADAVAVVIEMESDEKADLIMDLHEEDAEAILAEMESDDAEELRKLLSYAPDSAGGLMVTEYVSLDKSLLVKDAINHLRKNRSEYGDYQLSYLFIIGEGSTFLGMIEMHRLLLAEGRQSLADLAEESKTFSEDETLEDLHSFFEGHDMIGIPVLDSAKRIVGVVHRRDVFHATSERLSKEHLESQGIVGGEELRTMPILLRSRRRLSWLSVNIILNIIAASVIAFHQDILSSVIALAVFLPIISDMSGCSGNQAVAVSMRELAVGTVRPREILTVLGQEMSVGILNGIFLGLLIATAAWLWQGNAYLGLVVGGALTLNTVVAVCLGGTLPLLLKAMDIDPALASGPILTTITDMLGFFLTLTFASWALGSLI